MKKVLTEELPGQLFNLDQQCELAFGPGIQTCKYIVSEFHKKCRCGSLFCLDFSKIKFLAKGYGAAPALLAVEPDICLGLRAHLVVTIKYFSFCTNNEYLFHSDDFI